MTVDQCGWNAESVRWSVSEESQNMKGFISHVKKKIYSKHNGKPVEVFRGVGRNQISIFKQSL